MKKILIYCLILEIFVINFSFVESSIKKIPPRSLRQEGNCSEGCLECDYRGFCSKCVKGFTFYNGKCFDDVKVNSFIKDISENMENKQKEILSFLINKKPDEKSEKSMYIDINQGKL